ncbi:MAG: DNA repair protein RecO [Bacteroidetes bacterium]|nr:DNA repair protein RecO [Bacteroidota bacterium]
MIVETRAVVLKTIKYGDSSRIVTLYTKEYGKIKVVAKGARNQKTSKFGSSLEPMSVSSVVLYKKEQRDLHLLSKSEVVMQMTRLQDDPERMFAGLATVELVNMVMHDEEGNAPVYDLLEQTITLINGSERNSVNVFLSFMVKLFHRFGFGLAIGRCSGCGRDPEKEGFPYGLIRLSDGSLICPHCAESSMQGGVRLSGGLLRSLLFLEANPLERAAMLSLSTAMRDELLALLQSYLRYHIDGVRTLRSLALLQSV